MTHQPTSKGPDASYQDYLASGELRLQQCEQCARHVFYPRVLCPHCGSTQLQWRQASGNATVHACSVVIGRPGTNSDYAVILAELQEGVRMMGHVVDCDQHAVTIGMPLKARIVERDGQPLVVFAPAGAQGAAQ